MVADKAFHVEHDSTTETGYIWREHLEVESSTEAGWLIVYVTDGPETCCITLSRTQVEGLIDWLTAWDVSGKRAAGL